MSIQIYTDQSGEISLDVNFENETVWLSQKQMEVLFGRERSVITKHLGNVFREGELEEKSNVQNLHVSGSDKPVKFYNLDVIISVGYRVKSKQGVEFRKWATKILKDYLINGYAVNQKRISQKELDELKATIALIQNSIEHYTISDGEARGILDIISGYAKTWALLQGYDSSSLEEVVGTIEQRFVLDYDEAKMAIAELKTDLIAKNDATELFGNEKAGEFKGSLLNIYQTYGGIDLIPSIEEKAANLIYYIIKGHPFNDGNKRIGSFLFVLFLHKNGIAYKPNGEPVISDNALVSLALLVASSDPSQKELMIRLIVNLLVGEK